MTVGSLFSGIGGFDLGLERAGHRVLWQVEYDKQCRSVLRKHWPGVTIYEDVCDVGASDLARVDLICGGFPCQDLSVAGRRAGLDGERSGLWHEFRRIVAELAPTWVLIENVPGLRSSAGGRDLAAILRGLAELGYLGAWRCLDSQHFGVAQRRRRIFLLACRDPRAGSPAEVLAIPEGLSGHPAPGRAEGARVAASLTHGVDSAGRGGYAGRRREDDHNIVPVAFNWQNAGNEGYAFTEDATSPLDVSQTKAIYQVADTAYGFDPGQSSNPKTTDQLTVDGAPPLPAGQGAAGRLSVASGHTIPRRLTPTECERLQGFPDGWTALDDEGGAIADGPRYRMLGNAVTVNVAEWIGGRFA